MKTAIITSAGEPSIDAGTSSQSNRSVMNKLAGFQNEIVKAAISLDFGAPLAARESVSSRIRENLLLELLQKGNTPHD
jgi:hypothetical protein